MTSLHGRSLLVVDDRQADCDLMAALARGWGMDVTGTTQPEQALEWIRDGRRFDLVVLDYKMPGMNGAELANRIVEVVGDGRLPALMVTAFAVDGPELRGLAPFSALLPKPVRRAELRTAFEDVLFPVTKRAELATARTRTCRPCGSWSPRTTS